MHTLSDKYNRILKQRHKRHSLNKESQELQMRITFLEDHIGQIDKELTVIKEQLRTIYLTRNNN